ncbi:monovalent cation/H+ antiporter subunit D family protein [Paracoccaceae bacterium]|nr:monovalent cation/H+ antiporter subunit D family protein [Paracoccaceae bacterium]
MASEIKQGTLDLINHLPILQVITPMLIAPILVVLNNKTLSWLLSFVGALACLIISVLLIQAVSDGSTLTYFLGGWAPPIGIEYRIDAANSILLFLISIISVIVLIFSYSSLHSEIPEEKHTLFYACFLLCLTGLLGVVATADIFNVFVFLEISSLSTYVLVAQGSYRDRRALSASFNYLIMGTIGATFFVIGIGYIYMATGSLNMMDIAERVSELGDSRTVQAGFAFIVVGMGLKLAMVPLHVWLPNAYAFAPTVVTCFLAATATKVALYVLIRFVFSVFNYEDSFINELFFFLLMPLAIIAMIAASVIAIFKQNLKKLLAYSSLAQIGYMLLGLSLMSEKGLAASLVHMVNHGFTKAALFMSLGAFILNTKNVYMNSLQGLGRSMPFTSAAFVISGLSLIGVPGTAGFISKWLLLEAALESGYWLVAVLIILSSLFAVIYIWKIIEVLYFSESSKSYSEVSVLTLTPIWILSLFCIFLGINTSLTVDVANMAAEILFK